MYYIAMDKFSNDFARKSILIPTHFSVSKHSNNASLQFLALVHATIFKQISKRYTYIHIASCVLCVYSSVKLKYGPRKIKRRCVVYKFTMKTFFIFCYALRFLVALSLSRPANLPLSLSVPNRATAKHKINAKLLHF